MEGEVIFYLPTFFENFIIKKPTKMIKKTFIHNKIKWDL